MRRVVPMKSFLDGPHTLTHRERVVAAMADGWQSCKALQIRTGLSRLETHSALQQERKYHRIEAEHVCAGGKMRGVTQRYRLKTREQHDV